MTTHTNMKVIYYKQGKLNITKTAVSLAKYHSSNLLHNNVRRGIYYSKMMFDTHFKQAE